MRMALLLVGLLAVIGCGKKKDSDYSDSGSSSGSGSGSSSSTEPTPSGPAYTIKFARRPLEAKYRIKKTEKQTLILPADVKVIKETTKETSKGSKDSQASSTGKDAKDPKDNQTKDVKETLLEGGTMDLEEARSEYVEQILEESAGVPSKLVRNYKYAQIGPEALRFDLPYSGKVMTIERANDSYTFSYPGRQLSKEELKRLNSEFGKSGFVSTAAMTPKKPVKVGESWNMDKTYMQELNHDEDLKINVEKSSAVLKLAKVFTGSDEKQWGVIEGTFTLVPQKIEKTEGPVKMKMDSVKGTMTVEAPIDGSSAELSTSLNVRVQVSVTEKGAVKQMAFVFKTTESVKPEVDPDDVKALIGQLNGKDGVKKLAAVKHMGELGEKSRMAVPKLFALLDDPDPELQKASAEAIEKIGIAAETESLNAALSGTAPNARMFALKYYAANPATKVPENLLPVIVKTLSDPSAETKKLGLKILFNYGPGCKPKVLALITDLMSDEDPTVAAEAGKMFASFAPFAENERPKLVSTMKTSKNAAIRLTMATILAADAPDAASAMEWFKPALADSDPKVRAKAIEALAKWGAKVKECLPELLEKFDDDTTAIAVAAVKAAPTIDGGAMTVAAIKKLLASDKTRPEVKAAATDAALSLDLPDAETGVPVLVLLLEVEKPATKSLVIAKLAKFGTMAKPALEPLIKLIKDNDAGVKVAAMKAVAPFGADAADAIPSVASLLDGKQTDAVALAAVETLVKLGPKSIDPLIKALDAKLPKEALVKTCDGLASFGKDAAAAAPALMDAVVKQAALRNLMEDAAGNAFKQKSWTPDPVAAALAKVGGDEKLVKQLIDWASFEVKTIGGAKKRVAVKSDNTMLWAILVINSLDPEVVPQKSKDQIGSQMDALASFAPTAPCRDAAKTALAKFPRKKSEP